MCRCPSCRGRPLGPPPTRRTRPCRSAGPRRSEGERGARRATSGGAGAGVGGVRAGHGGADSLGPRRRRGGVMGQDVRWGVLGAANIARKAVIPAIRRAGAGEVLAVSSASGRAEAYAAELGIPRHYAGHAELLADPDGDAVYIALPNSEHARWKVAAAEAGKHVLCEKPIVQGLTELDAIEDACRRAGVQYAETFM